MSNIAPLPTASEVRIESRLSPVQVFNAPGFDVTALEGDIATRLQEQANIVELRLVTASLPLAWPLSDAVIESAFPAYTADQSTALSERQMTTAVSVVKLFTLASLYLSSGQMNEQFYARSEAYQKRGEDLLESLLKEVAFIKDHQTGTASTVGFGTFYTVPTAHKSYSEYRPLWYSVGMYED